MQPELIDSHAHLEMLKDTEGALERARGAGVAQVVSIGIDLESSHQAAVLAANHGQVYHTVGLHPHDASHMQETGYIKALKDLARSSGARAIGECGLDFFRNLSPKSEQEHAFRAQIELALELGLPLVIHDRDAHQAVTAILKEMQAGQVAGVVHCFSGDLAMAEQVLAMGFCLGITGTITFPKNQELRDLVKQVPLQNLLIETDCPYLAPVPFRGKPNEPAYVAHTNDALAAALCISPAETAAATTANARRVFKLPEAG